MQVVGQTHATHLVVGVSGSRAGTAVLRPASCFLAKTIVEVKYLQYFRTGGGFERSREFENNKKER